MKRIALFSLLLLALRIPLPSAVRVNREYTVAAGTSINVYTGLSSTLNTDQPVLVNRIFIQMELGGTGVGFVMDGVKRGTQGVATTASHLTAQLCAATASAPGCNYSDGGGSTDVSLMWIDGATNGDKIKVSYVPIN